MNFRNYILLIFVLIATGASARAEYGNHLYQLEECEVRLVQVEEALIQKSRTLDDLTLLAGVQGAEIDGTPAHEALVRIQAEIHALERHKFVLKRDIYVLRLTLLQGV